MTQHGWMYAFLALLSCVGFLLGFWWGQAMLIFRVAG